MMRGMRNVAWGCLVIGLCFACRTTSEDSDSKAAAEPPSPAQSVEPAVPVVPIERGLGVLDAMDGMFAVDSEDDNSPTPYRLHFKFHSPTDIRVDISIAQQGVWTMHDEQIPLTVTALRCPGCYQFDGLGSVGPFQITAMYLPTDFAGTPPTQVSITINAGESFPLTDLRFERLQTSPEAGADVPAGLQMLSGMRGDFTLAGLGISPVAGGVSEGEDYTLYLRFVSSSEATLDISYSDDRGYAERQVQMRVIAARCPGCFDFVGDGELGAIRIHAMYLPVGNSEFAALPMNVKINFRGYANLPVSRIVFDQN